MGGPRVLIDEDAFIHNFQALQASAHSLPLMPVIKADAYGHGAEIIAKICEERVPEEKNPYLVVARVTEARLLRSRGIRRRLLVLSEFSPDDFEAGWPESTDLAIHSLADVKTLLALPGEKKQSLENVQINVNTGMNRLGFACDPDLAPRVMAVARELRAHGIGISGLMTHLARGEDDPALCSSRQEQLFGEFLKRLRASWSAKEGKFPSFIHAANSPGILHHTAIDARIFNCARPGIALWGAWATTHDHRAVSLQPVARVSAPLRQVFWVPSGQGIGYGHRFVPRRRTLIGTVALGYADGVDRSFSRSEGEAYKVGFFIEGVKVPIVGTVSMDLTMVDLTDHPKASVWAQKTAEGSISDLTAYWICPEQSAEHIADALGTISYEVFCAMGSRLPRVRQRGGA